MKQGGRGRQRELWASLKLKHKLGLFFGAAILMVLLAVLFNLFVLAFYGRNVSSILSDNLSCYRYVVAVTEEGEAFERYAKYRTQNNRKLYEEAAAAAVESVRVLPYDYGEIGAERYAKTWNIKSAHEEYQKQNEAVLSMWEFSDEYIPSLYRSYATNDYLIGYGNVLVGDTLSDNMAHYQETMRYLYLFPVLLFAIGIMFCLLSMLLYRMLNRSITAPLYRLAAASERIAENDFAFDDIAVENRDEIYMLSNAFNKMKHSAKQYISTLEEKNEIAERLHQEVVEKMEVEKRLEQMNLELLKSQVNPHFLFNTLNMISCNAKLEHAPVTAQMTNSLSELFRYSLRNHEAVVVLRQELDMTGEYMYIQKMRFGERIQYELSCMVDENRIMIPTFTLQPLVENCIVHGLQKKEDGGTVCVRIFENGEKLVLEVADNGLGMSEERLSELLENIKLSRTAKVGIGVGNIYKRICSMYPKDGVFEIESRIGEGTIIHIEIPKRYEDETVQYSDSR